jgi:hypothetical protein
MQLTESISSASSRTNIFMQSVLRNALNHVMDTTRGTDDNMGTILEIFMSSRTTGATNAGMALNVHEVSNCNHDLLDLLGQLTGGCKNQSLALLDVGVKLSGGPRWRKWRFSGTRLGLCNDIVTLRIYQHSAIVLDC